VCQTVQLVQGRSQCVRLYSLYKCAVIGSDCTACIRAQSVSQTVQLVEGRIRCLRLYSLYKCAVSVSGCTACISAQ